MRLRQYGFSANEMMIALGLLSLIAALTMPFLVSNHQPSKLYSQDAMRATLNQALSSSNIQSGLLPLSFGPGAIFDEKLNANTRFNLNPPATCDSLSNGAPIGNRAFRLADKQVVITDSTWDVSRDYDTTTPQRDAGRFVCVLPKGEATPASEIYVVKLLREKSSLATVNTPQASPSGTSSSVTTIATENASIADNSNGLEVAVSPASPMHRKKFVLFTRELQNYNPDASNDDIASRLDGSLIYLAQLGIERLMPIFTPEFFQKLYDDPEYSYKQKIVDYIRRYIKTNSIKTLKNSLSRDEYLAVKDGLGRFNQQLKIRDTLGNDAYNLLKGLGSAPIQKHMTLVESNGQAIVKDLPPDVFFSRLTIDGESAVSYLANYRNTSNNWKNLVQAQHLFGLRFGQSNAYDWYSFNAATAELSDEITVVYTHTDGEEYEMSGSSVRYSPVKINLEGKDAKLDSDNRFRFDLDGQLASNMPVITTTGGLKLGEAWLVFDRNQNGVVYADGVLDGDDIFGDHLGRYHSGYEDLFATFKDTIEVDEKGQKYIPLHDLNPLETFWIWLCRLFGQNTQANPSYDLQLLDYTKQLRPARDVMSRIYVDYREVKEMDERFENTINQRAIVVFKNGQRADSADQWFSAEPEQD